MVKRHQRPDPGANIGADEQRIKGGGPAAQAGRKENGLANRHAGRGQGHHGRAFIQSTDSYRNNNVTNRNTFGADFKENLCYQFWRA